jgi:hypothetical protein
MVARLWCDESSHWSCAIDLLFSVGLQLCVLSMMDLNHADEAFNFIPHKKREFMAPASFQLPTTQAHICRLTLALARVF